MQFLRENESCEDVKGEECLWDMDTHVTLYCRNLKCYNFSEKILNISK